jgi:uncharacterized protein YjbI with pentapeptide repeats
MSNYTVAIQKSGSNFVYGTGIIVTSDGMILTCYHVVGDIKTKTLYKLVDIYFPESKCVIAAYPIQDYCDPFYDFAFLKLKDNLLPDKTCVAPLTKTIQFYNKFASIGFRKSNVFDKPLSSSGDIRPTTRLKSKEGIDSPEIIQLYSDEIEERMSGSAVLDLETKKVVGIISDHWVNYQDNVDSKLNFAISIDSIIRESKAASLIEPILRQNNPGFNPFLRFPELKQDLLEIVNEYKESKDGIRKPLEKYYIKQDVIHINLKDKILLKDLDSKIRRDLENPSSNLTIGVSIEKLIENILEEEKSRKYYKIIGASSYGIGKTSLVKYIAYVYAQNYLNNPYKSKFIPLTIYLKDENALGDELRDKIDNVISFVPEFELLLLIDGIEEYNKGSEKLKIELDAIIEDIKLRKKDQNTKAILTINLSKDINPGFVISDYIRLLPFTELQVNAFFKKCGANQLSYGKLIDYISSEEITKPLFAWMLSYIDTDLEIFKRTWTNEDNWNDNIKKTLIYMLFFYYTIMERLKGEKNYNEKEHIKEKQLLRKIAVLKQLLGESLVVEEEEHSYKLINPYKNSFDTNINSIPKSIFFSYFELIHSSTNMKGFKFVHHTFQEYLIAENYVENFLSGRYVDSSNIFQLGIPSKETMQFLDGLIGLLLIKVADSDLLDIIENEKSSLLNSSTYATSPSLNIKQLLETNAISCFKDEIIPLFIENNEMVKLEKSAVKARGGSEIYKSLWIHRWISLFFLSRVSRLPYELNDSLQILISYTANFTPGYIKKLRFDLSEINLSGANLEDTDLSNATFKFTNLSNANFREANLSGTNFSYSHMYSCFLSGAKLDHANLRLSHLIKSNLSYTDLSFANLFGSNLELADLRWSKMSNANLQFANLIGVNLSYADLSNAILIDINNFINLRCNNATKFKDAITNNNQLIAYLRDNGIIDLPKLVTDVNEIKEELRKWELKIQDTIKK